MDAFAGSAGDHPLSTHSHVYFLSLFFFWTKKSALLHVYKFINNPKLQERVFLINVQRNKWILRKDIKWFVGTKINNIVVTESGIIAAAHLAGPGNVKKYLRSGGEFNSKDAFGTSISMYMEYFKNYDLSMIEAVRKPKI